MELSRSWFRERPIYLISDGHRLRVERVLVERIERALIGGAGRIGFVQLREQVESPADRPAGDAELRALAAELHPICREYGAKLVINRRPDLAAELELDGVHLGSPVQNIAQIRDLLRPSKIIGYSAHSAEESLDAFAGGADYILLAPIFAPLSKAAESHVLGLQVLEVLRSKTDRPVIALGGVEPKNAAACRRAGADGIACISSVLLQPSPESAVCELYEAWNGEQT